MKEKGFGSVQRLHVECDTRVSLTAACAIALTEHQSATHYRVRENDDGTNTLVLEWTDTKNSVPLINEIKSPELLSGVIYDWLTSSARYPKQTPDTDGDYEEGFAAKQGEVYSVLEVTPAYIIYGK